MGDGRQSFIFGINNSELISKSREAENTLAGIGNTAEVQGARIDKAFEAKQTFADLKDQIRGLSEEISAQDGYVAKLKDQYAEMQAKAGAAFMSGQDKEYARLNQEMMSLNATIQSESRTLSDLNGKMAEATVTQAEYEKEIAKTNEKQKAQESILVSLMGGQEKYNTILKALPEPLRAGVSGIASMTKAAIAFIATPLGATIAGITLAIKALSAWFNSSAEGQMAFTKASAYLNGILGQLKEIVISAGKAIYEAFTNPKQAVMDLWDAIKTNIVNRVEGIGGMFKALGQAISKSLQFDFSGAGDSLKELGNQFIKSTTGVDNLTGKVGGYVAGLHEAAKATQDLKVAEEKLSIDRSKFGVEEAKLRAEADEAYQRYQKSGMKDRAALTEYETNINKIYDQREAFAKEELRIKKGLADITTNSLQDNEALNDAERDLIAVQSERIAALRRADRAAAMLGRKDEGQAATEAKRIEQEYTKERLNQATKLREEQTAAERALIKDKEQLRQFDLNQALAAIEREKQAYIDLAKAKGEKAPETAVFEQRKAVAVSTSEEDRTRNQAEANKTILEQYATFSQKYIAKTKEMIAKRNEILAAGGTMANVDVLLKQVEDEQKALDKAFFEQSAGFEEFSKSIVGASIKQLTDLLTEAENQLRQSSEGIETESNAVLRAQIEALKKQLKAAAPEEGKAGEQDIKRWQATEKLMSDIIKTSNDVIDGFDGISDSVKEILKTTINVAAGTISLISGVTQFANFSVTATKMAADGASAAIISLEKASVILTIISAAVQVVTAITNIFTSAAKKRAEAQKKMDENQRAALVGEMELNQQYRERYEWAQKIGESQLQNIKRQGDELKKQATSNQADQKKLMSLLSKEQYVVSESFKKTGLFGWGKGKIVQEMGSLAGMKYEDLERLSAQKKLTESAEQYFQALKKAKEEGEDIAQQQIEFAENLRGLTTGSAYEDVVTRSMQILKSGIQGAGKAFDELMTGAVESAIKLLADERMREWYENFAKMGEGGYTPEEIAQAKRDYLATLEKLDADAKALEEATGVSIREKYQQGQAKAGEFQLMSQDTGTALEGKFTAFQISNAEIADNTATLVRIEPLMGDIRESIDILAVNSKKALEHLGDISKNTKLINDTNTLLKQVVSNTGKL